MGCLNKRLDDIQTTFEWLTKASEPRHLRSERRECNDRPASMTAFEKKIQYESTSDAEQKIEQIEFIHDIM